MAYRRVHTCSLIRGIIVEKKKNSLGRPSCTHESMRSLDARGERRSLPARETSCGFSGVCCRRGVMRVVSLFSAVGLFAVLAGCGSTRGDAGRLTESSDATAARSPSSQGLSVSRSCGILNVAAVRSEPIPGTPCAMVLWRYRALHKPPRLQLVGRADIRSPVLLRRLTSEFDALPPVPEGGLACPNDNGSRITADLKYRHHRTLRLTASLSGCPEARRGLVTRSALGRIGAKLIGQLEALTRAA